MKFMSSDVFRARKRVACWLLLPVLALLTLDACACGATIPVAQVGQAVPYMQGIGNFIDIGAPNGSFQLAWYGESSGVLSLRIVGADGGTVVPTYVSGASYTQPASNELDLTGIWYPQEAPIEAGLAFSGSSQIIAFKIDAGSIQPQIYYTNPDLSVASSSQYEFALSVVPAGAAIPNSFENIYCSGFE